MFGNPTKNKGKFKDAFKHDSGWYTLQVDSRDVAMTNKNQIAKWEIEYGEDSDFFRVRVKGIFPRYGSMQLISEEQVEEAMARRLSPELYDFAPKIFGIDVSYTGMDKHAIGYRQGLFYKGLATAQHLPHETMGLVDLTIQMDKRVKGVDAMFVDVVGVGAGVCDRLAQLKYPAIPIAYNKTPSEPDRFKNKRAECWWKAREFIFAGGAIYPDKELAEELYSVEYGLTETGLIYIESKDDIRETLGRSPDKADALTLTFSHEVKADPLQMMRDLNPEGNNEITRYIRNQEGNRNQANTEYDVLGYGG